LKVKKQPVPGRLLSNLTEEQKQEVLLACDESEDESNLIDWVKVFQWTK
jgi:hypothetical protein